jgi:hypothetical protein
LQLPANGSAVLHNQPFGSRAVQHALQANGREWERVFEICANTHFAKPFYLLAYSNKLEDSELLLVLHFELPKMWRVVFVKKGVKEKWEIK